MGITTEPTTEPTARTFNFALSGTEEKPVVTMDNVNGMPTPDAATAIAGNTITETRTPDEISSTAPEVAPTKNFENVPPTTAM